MKQAVEKHPEFDSSLISPSTPSNAMVVMICEMELNDRLVLCIAGFPRLPCPAKFRKINNDWWYPLRPKINIPRNRNRTNETSMPFPDGGVYV